MYKKQNMMACGKRGFLAMMKMILIMKAIVTDHNETKLP